MALTAENVKNLSPEQKQKLKVAIQQELADRESGASQEPSQGLALGDRILGGIGKGLKSLVGEKTLGTISGGLQKGLERVPQILGTAQKPSLADELLEAQLKAETITQPAEERKAVTQAQQSAALKGIDIGQPQSARDARTALAEGIQEQTRSKREAKVQQAVIKEQSDLDELTTDIQIIRGDVDELFNTFRKIPANLRGPIEGRTRGALAAFFQTDPSLVQYEDARQFFLSNISRKLGGERGVLTDRDIERVDKMFPQREDTDEVASGKIKRIEGFIQRRIDEHTERIKTKIGSLEAGNIVPQEEGEDVLPEDVTEEDIQFTMQKHGLSRVEVLNLLR